jgi:lysylphosphatidylglycerol synthetase-like protein (DUF2156 family)
VGVAILAILIMLFGVVVIIVGLAIALVGGLLGFAFGGPLLGAFGAAIGFVVLIFGAIVFVAGQGLWRMRSWAFWLTAILLVLSIVSSIFSAGAGGIILPIGLLIYLLLVRKHFNT